jgi:hypothetical protein
VAVSVAALPAQIVTEFTLTLGGGLTVNDATVELAPQPLSLVTTQTYPCGGLFVSCASLTWMSLFVSVGPVVPVKFPTPSTKFVPSRCH